MAHKKGAVVHLQSEINCDEDWEKLVSKEGLIVVDVYSEWCGPCAAMSAMLKKIKLESGGDDLLLAMAKSDNIAVLERFREKSEPTWLFILQRKMINLMFGSNSPKLAKMVLDELKKYVSSKETGLEREGWSITSLAEEEKERSETVGKKVRERENAEREAKEKAFNERMLGTCKNILEQYGTLGVILATPLSRDFIMGVLQDYLEPNHIRVQKHDKITLTEEGIEELLFFTDFRFEEEDIEAMLADKCLALLIEPQDGFEGDMDDFLLQLLYGPSKKPPGSKDSFAQKIITTIENHKAEMAAAAAALQADVISALSGEKSIKATGSVDSGGEKMEDQKMEDNKDDKKEENKDEKTDENKEEVQLLTMWAPMNELTKALSIKVFFPKISESYLMPEPEPIPPHILVAFDATKRTEVLDLAQEYPEDVMRYGFFTSEVPEDAKFIAKTVLKFERKVAETQYGEKLIMQLSKKRSDAVLAFAQLGPSYMSANAEEGEIECKEFFPEGYDDLEEVVEPLEKPKKPKKKKKKPLVVPEGEEGVAVEEIVVKEVAAGEVGEAPPKPEGEEPSAEPKEGEERIEGEVPEGQVEGAPTESEGELTEHTEGEEEGETTEVEGEEGEEGEAPEEGAPLAEGAPPEGTPAEAPPADAPPAEAPAAEAPAGPPKEAEAAKPAEEAAPPPPEPEASPAAEAPPADAPPAE